MENKTLDRVIIFSGIVLLIILTYLALKELLFSVLLAFIFAYAFRPTFVSINKKLKMKGLSALILIIALIAIIVLPLIFLTPQLIKQTFSLYDKIQGVNIGDLIENTLPSSVSPEVLQTIKLQFNNILSNLFSSLISGFSSFLADLPVKLLNFVIFLTVFYFILIDFDKITFAIKEFIPLSEGVKRKFAAEFRNVTDGTLYGEVLVGILQGILMGLIMFLLGIEGTLLFTIVAIIAGVLPMVGPTVVWLPLGIVLIANGSPIKAIILALWGMGVSGVSDYILRPYILSKRTLLPVGLSFVSSIGGLLSFGLIGLVLGPLFVSYLLIVLQFYKQGNFKELFRS